MVLEKRGKSLKNSKNAKTKGSNEDSVDAGKLHLILEMDIEKLKKQISNALSWILDTHSAYISLWECLCIFKDVYVSKTIKYELSIWEINVL